MKLHLISEGSELTLYKGTSEWSGLQNWPEHRVGHTGTHTPGFLSTYHVALIYSEPELTGPSDQDGMIAEVKINQSMVEDRTQQFIKWCDENDRKDYDVSSGYPSEWRNDNSIWTISDSGSAHAGVSCFDNASFVYCGVPMKYRVVNFFHNQDEWSQAWNKHRYSEN